MAHFSRCCTLGHSDLEQMMFGPVYCIIVNQTSSDFQKGFYCAFMREYDGAAEDILWHCLRQRSGRDLCEGGAG